MRGNTAITPSEQRARKRSDGSQPVQIRARCRSWSRTSCGWGWGYGLRIHIWRLSHGPNDRRQGRMQGCKLSTTQMTNSTISSPNSLNSIEFRIERIKSCLKHPSAISAVMGTERSRAETSFRCDRGVSLSFSQASKPYTSYPFSRPTLWSWGHQHAST